MEHYRYKNNSVEIFAAKIGEKWTAAFMINGHAGKSIKEAHFDTKELATEAAKVEAEAVIERGGNEVQCELLPELQSMPPGISA